MNKGPKYQKSKIPKLTTHKGFTLVEILVSIIILTVGILAVSQMTVLGMQSSSTINRRLYARDVLNRYYEFLHSLPTRDSLVGHRSSANLEDTIGCDRSVYETTQGGIYRVIWNVDDSFPDERFKTVRLHVLSRSRTTYIHLRSDALKRY